MLEEGSVEKWRVFQNMLFLTLGIHFALLANASNDILKMTSIQYLCNICMYLHWLRNVCIHFYSSLMDWSYVTLIYYFYMFLDLNSNLLGYFGISLHIMYSLLGLLYTLHILSVYLNRYLLFLFPAIWFIILRT